MISDDLRARRLALLEEHFASEVEQEFTNERVYLDAASLLTQIGRGDLLALAGS